MDEFNEILPNLYLGSYAVILRNSILHILLQLHQKKKHPILQILQYI